MLSKPAEEMTFRSQLEESLKTHAGVFEKASVIERAPFHMTNKHSLSWSKGTLFVQPFQMLKLIPFLRYRLYFANTVASLSSMLNCCTNCSPITACIRGSAATHHVSCQSLSDSVPGGESHKVIREISLSEDIGRLITALVMRA